MNRGYSRRGVLSSAGLILFAGAGCVGQRADSTDDESDTVPASNGTTGADPSSDASDSDDSGPADPPDDGVFDDFEDLSRWEVLDGSVSADTDVYVTGDGSARIDVGAGDVRVAIARTFDAPIDLSGLHPHLAIRTEDTIYPRIRLIDDTGDVLEFRADVRSDLEFQHYDFGISDLDGDPDLSAIAEVQFTQYVGADDQLRLWVDDFRISAREQPGVVCIHFDDALETDYTEALPILDAHDMAASTFINPGYVGRTIAGSPRLTIDQIAALADSGWDICSHGMNHVNLAEASEDETESEIRDAQHWLLDHGFDTGARFFAYPYAAYDQHTLDRISEYHDLAFTAGWAALGRCGNSRLVPRAAGDPGYEDAKDVIDITAEYGGVSTLFYHQLGGDRLEAFERTIGYLQDRQLAGDIAVRTVSDIASDLAYDPPGSE